MCIAVLQSVLGHFSIAFILVLSDQKTDVAGNQPRLSKPSRYTINALHKKGGNTMLPH